MRALETGDDEGYFGPGSAVWEVHSGIPTVVAGIRALLMQTLHPGAMAGVHDHSRYQQDPLGRLAGTVRWVLTTTFADRAQAEAGCAWVSRLHERVRGEYAGPDGTPRDYRADDADLIGWVHCVFADAFIGSHETWGGPVPGGSDQYVREWAVAGELMGMAAPPRSRAELDAAIASYIPVLRRDERVDGGIRLAVDVHPCLGELPDQLLEERDRLGTVEPGGVDLAPAQLADPPGHSAGAGQVVVVERDEHAVLGDLHIGLDVPVAEVDGVLERRHRVLGCITGASTVGERHRAVPVEIRVRGGGHGPHHGAQ